MLKDDTPVGGAKTKWMFSGELLTSGFPSKAQQGQTALVTLEKELHSLRRWDLSFYKLFIDVIKILALLTTEQTGNCFEPSVILLN